VFYSSHGEGSVAKEIFLWMDTTPTPGTAAAEDVRMGALLWKDTEADQTKSTDSGSFSLASLRDVFVGKHTLELHSDLASTVCAASSWAVPPSDRKERWSED
jgi:hypothetical protein